MNLEIKKDLTSNWFKSLQNSICNTICKLENNKVKFNSTTWKRNQKKNEGGHSLKVYFMYSVLSLPKILGKLTIFVFLYQFFS